MLPHLVSSALPGLHNTRESAFKVDFMRMVIDVMTVQASIREDLNRRIEELSHDAFYNEHNQKLLLEAINDMKAGKGVTHELINCE